MDTSRLTKQIVDWDHRFSCKEVSAQGVDIFRDAIKAVIGIVGLYLSPSNYRYGQDAEGFFNNVAVLWQDLYDCDLLIGAGDVNARTKEILDFTPEIDGDLIPKRSNPENLTMLIGNVS